MLYMPDAAIIKIKCKFYYLKRYKCVNLIILLIKTIFETYLNILPNNFLPVHYTYIFKYFQ